MRFSTSSSCLTRVRIYGDVSADVAQVQDLMLHIQRSLTEVPHPQRVYVGNAL
jgi:hypothetical protein